MTKSASVLPRGTLAGALAAIVLMAEAAAAPVGVTAGAPLTAAGSYLAGRHAQQAEDWGNAARFMEQALSFDPGNVALLRRTYLLQLGEGRIDEARALARRLVDGDPASHLATALLAADDLKAGRIQEAQRRLAGPTGGDGLAQYVTPLLRVWLAVAEGRPEQAVQALAPLAAVSGFAALNDLQTALIYDQAGRPAEAATAYAKAADGGASLRVIQLVGNFHERAGRPAEARRLYEKFQAEAPDSLLVEPALAGLAQGRVPAPLIGSATEGMAEALFDLASALHQEGASELALLYGRIALHLRPDFPLARLMIGDVLASRRRFEEAIAEYRQVGGDAGMAWVARLRTAEQLQRLTRDDEAAALLEAMAAERPERLDALIALGDVHRGNEAMEQAVSAYDRAIARLERPEPRHWGLFYARGMALERAQQWARAEADLLRALELSPEQPYVLNYLGYSWVDRGQNLDRAKKMIQRAVELRPNDGYIVDSLGWVLYRLGDFPGAVLQLERAIELRPVDATINDHLGDAYWQVGRRDEARFQWQRALQNTDDPALASAIRTKLSDGLPRQTAGRSAPGAPPSE